MKILALLLLCISCTGCFYQTVNEYDIVSAYEVCMKRQTKVVEIQSNFGGGEVVICSDGFTSRLHEDSRQ